MKRRAVLATGATAAAVGLSGCLSRGGDFTDPTVDHDAIGTDWEEVNSNEGVVFEDAYGPITVTAREHRVMYENVALREEVREKTLDGLDAQLSLVFATRIDISPAADKLPFGAGRKELMDQIESVGRQQFEQQLRANDLEDVEEADTEEWTAAGGHTGTLTEYEAAFAVEDMTFDLVGDSSLTIEGTDMDVSGWLAAWHDGDYPMLAGGLHPAENFSRTIEETLSDAIDLTLRIDLGLEPEAYREEVRDVIASVQ